MLSLLKRYQVAIRQFIKFGITGTIGAVVDFGTLFILHDIFKWTTIYTLFGSKLIAANMVSVFVAIVSNFLLNKYWTFRNQGGQAAKQWTGYFILNCITWALNQLLTSFFTFQVPFLGVFGESRIYMAKALAIGFILIINFIGSKFIVFRKNPQAPASI